MIWFDWTESTRLISLFKQLQLDCHPAECDLLSIFATAKREIVTNATSLPQKRPEMPERTAKSVEFWSERNRKTVKQVSARYHSYLIVSTDELMTSKFRCSPFYSVPVTLFPVHFRAPSHHGFPYSSLRSLRQNSSHSMCARTSQMTFVVHLLFALP